MNQRIEITVAPDGSTKVETKGFFGKACQAASRFIEQALGKVTEEKVTSEFHQAVCESPRESINEG